MAAMVTHAARLAALAATSLLLLTACGPKAEAPAELAPLDALAARALPIYEAHRESWEPCQRRLSEAQARFDAGDHSLIVKADLQVGTECVGDWLTARRLDLHAAGIPLDKAQTAYDRWSGADQPKGEARFGGE